MIDVIENIAIIVSLFLAGVAATLAVLVGLVYFFEITDD